MALSLMPNLILQLGSVKSEPSQKHRAEVETGVADKINSGSTIVLLNGAEHPPHQKSSERSP